MEDLKRLALRSINKYQVIILRQIPKVPTSITSVLREIARKHNVTLSSLKRNANLLRDLNLITYGDAPSFEGVQLTELGHLLTNLIVEEEKQTERIVRTEQGSRLLSSVITELRKHVLMMVAEAGSGHLGASLSCVDILSVLYFVKMKHDPKNPSWTERDRFILSKGHAAPALYAVLAQSGYFPIDELRTLRDLGSRLQGHADIRTPGVDAMSGSLGQGLSIGVGMALAGKLNGSHYRVYVLLGDGELNEGEIWEAAMTAAHHKLDNLTAIIDRNGFQLTDETEEIKLLEPLHEKWESFGWMVQEANGHDAESIIEALEQCTQRKGRPSVLIAKTTKGRGVSFMEGNTFGNKVPNSLELDKALTEVSGGRVDNDDAVTT